MASSREAGSPFVNAVECEQSTYQTFFLRTQWFAVRHAADTGLFVVDAKRYLAADVERLVEIHSTPPQVAIRNEEAEARIDHQDLQDGVTSKQIIAAKRGYDYEKVKQDLAEDPVQPQGQQNTLPFGALLGQEQESFYPAGFVDRALELRRRYGPALSSVVAGAATLLLESRREGGKGAVPNKTGTGCHDSDTGHPAKCPGGEETRGQEHDSPEHTDHAAVSSGLWDKARAAVDKAKEAAAAVGSWLDSKTDVPVVKQAKGVIGGALGKVKALQDRLMDVMTKRYGKRTARAIFIAGQAIGSNPAVVPPWFIAIPGSTFLAQLPLMAGAEAVLQVSRAGKHLAKKAGIIESLLQEAEEEEVSLTPEQIEQAGQELIDQLYQVFFAELESHNDELSQAFEGFKPPEQQTARAVEGLEGALLLDGETANA
jgi:hypothetical protein